MLNADLFGKWVLSNESDIDRRIKTYRRWTSDILLMEDMQGFEIKQNADFISYGFDESDRPTTKYGKFTSAKGHSRIKEQ